MSRLLLPVAAFGVFGLIVAMYRRIGARNIDRLGFAESTGKSA
jgi:hypothetical protein